MSKSSLITCANCKTDTSSKWSLVGSNFFCEKCGDFGGPDYETYDSLSPKKFMQNNKAWRADIKNRKLLPNGKIARFKLDKHGNKIRYG